jgi:hypothetical protein
MLYVDSQHGCRKVMNSGNRFYRGILKLLGFFCQCKIQALFSINARYKNNEIFGIVYFLVKGYGL